MANSKSRYWWAVLYTENMKKNWQDEIDELVQVPYCYCVHDKDVDAKNDQRKEHVHLILCWEGPTTYKKALDVFSELSAEGKDAVNTCQNVINIRHCYDYLIHNTKTCEKKKKHLYSVDERIEGNNFEIGNYEQIGIVQKREMLKELQKWVMKKKFTNFADLTSEILEMDPIYYEIYIGYNAMFERMCRANYLKAEAQKEAEKNRKFQSRVYSM